MKRNLWVLPFAATLLTCIAWGGTQLSSCPAGSCRVWGGFEDNASFTVARGAEFIPEATNGSETFSSDMGQGMGVTTPAGNASHFAFFTASPVPEPTIILSAAVLLSLKLLKRAQRAVSR